MAFEDKKLVCADCGNEFIFSADEQAYYAEKGFENEPKRCKPCRGKRKERGRGRGAREMHKATCADCGNETEVPFKPTTGKPIYCAACYRKRRS